MTARLSLSLLKARIAAGLLFGLGLTCLPVSAHAQQFPELTGRVVDNANYLPPAEQTALEQRLADFEAQTGHQLVVVTLPNLKGGGNTSYPEDDFTYRLGREWGIGDEARNDGVILLAANEEHRVRIEVGYGLEPVLTDALSATIIRNEIVPRFRGGDMAGGITAGADAIMTQLALPEEEALARQNELLRSDVEASGEDGDALGVILFNVGIFVFFFFVLPWLIGGRRRGTSIWVGGGSGWGSGGGGWSGGGGGFSGGGGGFSGGGGSFGGGGASGGW